LRSTNDDPRHVTPIITNIGAIRYTLGATRRKSIDVVAPTNPNVTNNFFR